MDVEEVARGEGASGGAGGCAEMEGAAFEAQAHFSYVSDAVLYAGGH